MAVLKDYNESIQKWEGVGAGYISNDDGTNKSTPNEVKATKDKTDGHVASKANPHTVTKAQVGLGNVDNVKQASKVEHDALGVKVSEHLADYAQLKGDLSTLNTTAKDSIPNIVNELFTNVSNGKQLVGNAITGVDESVVIPTDPTFGDLASAIGNISTGKKWASGTFSGSSAFSSSFRNVTGNTQNRNTMEVNGLDFTPSVVVYQATEGANIGYNIGAVTTLGPKHSSGFHNFSDGTILFRLTAPASLRPGGFTLPIQGALDHFWIAFE